MVLTRMLLYSLFLGRTVLLLVALLALEEGEFQMRSVCAVLYFSKLSFRVMAVAT